MCQIVKFYFGPCAACGMSIGDCPAHQVERKVLVAPERGRFGARLPAKYSAVKEQFHERCCPECAQEVAGARSA